MDTDLKEYHPFKQELLSSQSTIYTPFSWKQTIYPARANRLHYKLVCSHDQGLEHRWKSRVPEREMNPYCNCLVDR